MIKENIFYQVQDGHEIPWEECDTFQEAEELARKYNGGVEQICGAFRVVKCTGERELD